MLTHQFTKIHRVGNRLLIEEESRSLDSWNRGRGEKTRVKKQFEEANIRPAG